MNQKKNIDDRIAKAIQRDEPKRPDVTELGGGFYYTCFWAKCNTTLNKWMNYCPVCGQRIDWGEGQENNEFGFNPWQE